MMHLWDSGCPWKKRASFRVFLWSRSPSLGSNCGFHRNTLQEMRIFDRTAAAKSYPRIHCHFPWHHIIFIVRQIHKAGRIKEHAFSNGLWQNSENRPPETLLVWNIGIDMQYLENCISCFMVLLLPIAISNYFGQRHKWSCNRKHRESLLKTCK